MKNIRISRRLRRFDIFETICSFIFMLPHVNSSSNGNQSYIDEKSQVRSLRIINFLSWHSIESCISSYMRGTCCSALNHHFSSRSLQVPSLLEHVFPLLSFRSEKGLEDSVKQKLVSNEEKNALLSYTSLKDPECCRSNYILPPQKVVHWTS